MADPLVQSLAEALRARPDSRSQATANGAVACPQTVAAGRISTVACGGAGVRKTDSIAPRSTFFSPMSEPHDACWCVSLGNQSNIENQAECSKAQ